MNFFKFLLYTQFAPIKKWENFIMGFKVGFRAVVARFINKIILLEAPGLHNSS